MTPAMTRPMRLDGLADCRAMKTGRFMAGASRALRILKPPLLPRATRSSPRCIARGEIELMCSLIALPETCLSGRLHDLPRQSWFQGDRAPRDSFVATALPDRLLRHAVVLPIEDSSYPLRGHADLRPEAIDLKMTATVDSIPPTLKRDNPPPKSGGADHVLRASNASRPKETPRTATRTRMRSSARPLQWWPSASGSSPRSKTSSPRIRLARLERALVSSSQVARTPLTARNVIAIAPQLVTDARSGARDAPSRPII
jgi:hypothetical protein